MLLISLCAIGVFIILALMHHQQTVTECIGLGYDNSWKFYSKTMFFVFFATLLIMVSTLRYGFIDTYAYKIMYESARGDLRYVNSAPWGVEAGWLYFCYYLNFITDNTKLILFLTALIVNVAYVSIIKKYSCDSVFSLFIYFCVLFLDTNNGMRQMFAAAIVILAFPLLTRKKVFSYILYILLVILAYQLHESSIYCLVIAFIALGKPLNFKVVLAIGICIVFLLAPSLVNEYIGDLFSESKYLFYLAIDNGMSILRALSMGVVPLALSLIYIYRSKSKNIEIAYDESVLLNMVILNSVFILMGLVMQYWARFAFYTYFASFIMIPKLIHQVFDKKDRTYLKFIAYLCYFVFFAYNIYANVTNGALDKFYISLL